jgi:Glycosyltransferase family 87
MLTGDRIAPGSLAASRQSGFWRDVWRPVALTALGLSALAGYRGFALLVPANGTRPLAYPVVRQMLTLLLPYGAAMALLLLAHGPWTARWRWAEGGVLGIGAVLFRVPLLSLAPQSSADVYRYAWDARLTAHGLSPYLHGPAWPGYVALRDTVLYPHVPWKDVPSIYPPAAQFCYWLVGLVAPGNIYALKAEMALFDLVAGGLLALLLARRGIDPRRAAICLWAPLPVVEFALNGHEDSIAIAFIVLALLLDTCAFRGARVLVGMALGIATLAKLYPLLLVMALIRRRDRAMPVALGVSVVLGYVPYLGEGPRALGFLSTYLTQVQVSYGGALLLVRVLGAAAGATANDVRLIGAVLAGGCVALVAWLRLHPIVSLPPRAFLARLRRVAAWLDRLPRIDVDTTACALIAIWLAFSPHDFPWYAAALLPFVALLLRKAPGLAYGAWLFVAFMPLAYVAYDSPPLFWFYPALYLACCALALAVVLVRTRALRAFRAGLAPALVSSLQKGSLP